MRSFLALINIACVLVVMSAPLLSYAQATDLTVTPTVIDEKAKPRDIIKESISITNTTGHKISVFPTVRENSVAPDDTAAPPTQGNAALSAALSTWIELARGVVDLAPGEQKVIPCIIRVNMNAVAGTYHAHITFATGDTRDEAEKTVPLADVLVSVDVAADIKEIMQLNKFTTDSIVFTGDDVLFKYQLQNIGNQDLEPSGDIRIYNRNGEEVAAIDVNKEGRLVTPDQVAQLASVWNAVHGFGKYKALINVTYGKGQTAAVQDTVFFWVIPWKEMLGLLVVSLVAIIFLAWYFHRRFEERHLGKLASAGLLKPEAFAQLTHVAPPAASVPSKPSLSSVLPHSVMPHPVAMRPTMPNVARSVSAPEVPRFSAPTMPQTDGTINLKNLRHSEHVVRTEDNVINLRKNP